MKISGQENNYWDARYSAGGTSGYSSINIFRERKWEIIESYVSEFNDIIDVGCGDLSFWEGRDCPNYTGIDISPTIIKTNQITRPHWKFILADASITQPIQARIVFCFDILFHVMNDESYKEILRNLSKYSKEWIFIYTWRENPFIYLRPRFRIAFNRLIEGKIFQAFKMLIGSTTDFHYQKFRDLSECYPIFDKAGFELQTIIGDFSDPWGAMYIFRKNDK